MLVHICATLSQIPVELSSLCLLWLKYKPNTSMRNKRKVLFSSYLGGFICTFHGQTSVKIFNVYSKIFLCIQQSPDSWTNAESHSVSQTFLYFIGEEYLFYKVIPLLYKPSFTGNFIIRYSTQRFINWSRWRWILLWLTEKCEPI